MIQHKTSPFLFFSIVYLLFLVAGGAESWCPHHLGTQMFCRSLGPPKNGVIDDFDNVKLLNFESYFFSESGIIQFLFDKCGCVCYGNCDCLIKSGFPGWVSGYNWKIQNDTMTPFFRTDDFLYCLNDDLHTILKFRNWEIGEHSHFLNYWRNC